MTRVGARGPFVTGADDDPSTSVGAECELDAKVRRGRIGDVEQASNPTSPVVDEKASKSLRATS